MTTYWLESEKKFQHHYNPMDMSMANTGQNKTINGNPPDYLDFGNFGSKEQQSQPQDQTLVNIDTS